MIKNNIIIATFIRKHKILSFLEFLKNRFYIKSERVFIFEISNNKDEYLVTFRTNNKSRYLSKIHGSTVMHMKNGCLFSINALNKLISIENNIGVPDNEFILNWEKYKSKLLLLTNGVLNIQDINKIENVKELL